MPRASDLYELALVGGAGGALGLLVFGSRALRRVARRLADAGVEDAAWARARLALAEGGEAVEAIAWDTRVLRPWGHSNAVASFVMRARRDGFAWLEPVVVPLQEHDPVGVRALVGKLGGRGVAFVHVYGRKGSASRLAVEGAPVVVLDPTSSGAPPEDLRARLEAQVAAAAR